MRRNPEQPRVFGRIDCELDRAGAEVVEVEARVEDAIVRHPPRAPAGEGHQRRQIERHTMRGEHRSEGTCLSDSSSQRNGCGGVDAPV